jgi:hypothetical protein
MVTEGKEPLDIAVAGLNNGEMVVKSGGVLYVHKTGRALKLGGGPAALPHRPLEPMRMSRGVGGTGAARVGEVDRVREVALLEVG